MTNSQRHHHRHRKTRPSGHTSLASNIMSFKSKTVVNPGVDTLNSVSAPVSAFPRCATTWGRSKNTTVLLKRDTDDSAITSGLAASITVTLLPAAATQIERGCRTAEFQSAPFVFTAPGRHLAFRSAYGTATPKLCLFRVKDIVVNTVQRSHNPLPGHIVLVLLLLFPQFSVVNNRTDSVIIPELLFQSAA